MMQLKEYQQETLKAVRIYLETLAELRAKDVKARAIDPELSIDWPAKTWEKVKGDSYYLRRNGLRQPLPSFCLKIPTGGGKTLLATKIIDLVNTHFRRSNRGLVLWIVPTTQIYRQTLAALRDRDHPYRQTLDNASGARTLVLERTQRFTPTDVAQNLCVLMLMLPAAAKQNKQTLRMFHDSGFDAFFPTEEDYAGHAARLNEVPNLDTFDTSEFSARQIKTSLGNTLRTHAPLVILDEGQKAYSPLARETIEGFNPCMLVELSATPPQGANVLVDVRGTALEREGMVKLDLHLFNETSVDWKNTLLSAAAQRDRLEVEARDHAEDAREYLLQRPGVTTEMVAVKTSEKDELKEVDNVGGLLGRECPIRYIITKQALQEGWDCAFAYVLAVLTNPTSKTALTQLVGRILRQPDGRKTGNHCLDESYVFCFQRKGAELLKEIRSGFGNEGLGDLKGRIVEGTGDRGNQGEREEFSPRARFRRAAEHLVLPAFMVRDGREWRPVHYEPDILARVPWGEANVDPLLTLSLPDEDTTGRHTRHGLGGERILQDEETAARGERLEVTDDEEPDCAFAASHLLDVMPNPWRGNEIARQVFANLLARYDHRRVLDNYVFVLDEMHRRLREERDRLAREVFFELLKQDTMRFMVVTDELGFNRLPKVLTVAKHEVRANNEQGKSYQLGLFEDLPAAGFNELERAVATFLDAQAQLFFWYRNRSRHDYFVQGWQPHRIYADFIFTTAARGADPGSPEIDRVFVVETKGKHLAGVKDAAGKLTDTGYKREVFTLCTDLATKRKWSELVASMASKTMHYEVVDEDGWKARLSELLNQAT